MKAFASASPDGPGSTNCDPEKLEVCIPGNCSLTAIINLESLEASSSDNITRTVESIDLLTEFLHVKANAIKAKKDLMPDLAREHELRAEKLETRLLAQFNGTLLLL